MESNAKKLVIIDTDCGIDDAMAIMLATYCQKNELIEILAITCVHGNTDVENVVTNVAQTLRASQLESIKIYKGCKDPIIGSHESAPHYGADGMGGASEELPSIDVHQESEHAVNALVRLAKQYPKIVTLLALGPLTNIALAYRLDNQFFDNLERIVFMGGTIDSIGNVGPTTEFNVIRDPEACHIMLTKAKCPITIVPWECGLSNLLTWDMYHKVTGLNSAKSEFLRIILAKDYERKKAMNSVRKGLILCDILVIVAVAYPQLIEFTQVYQTLIELNGHLTRGQLVLDKRSGVSYAKLDAPNVEFITRFDVTKLNKLLLNFVQ